MRQWKKDILRPWVDIWKNSIFARFEKRLLKVLIKEIDDRKLDIEVADKIFGRKVEILEFLGFSDEGGDYEYPRLGFKIKQDENPELVKEGADPFWYEKVELPKYSTDIKDAWLLVEKLREKNDWIELIITSPTLKGPKFHVNIGQNWADHQRIFGDTPELAICNAALEING